MDMPMKYALGAAGTIATGAGAGAVLSPDTKQGFGGDELVPLGLGGAFSAFAAYGAYEVTNRPSGGFFWLEGIDSMSDDKGPYRRLVTHPGARTIAAMAGVGLFVPAAMLAANLIPD